MKLILLLSLSILLMSAGWRTDFDKARADAVQDHKLLLLKFSGSDWCLPCIRMEKEVFADDSFARFAAANLVVVQADFPRLASHKQDKALVKQNEALAEQYNKDGHFPCTVLMDANGKVLKVWNGYTGNKPADYIQQIATLEHAM